jgi:uncharacterized membrane protein YphA (DoxX/SURF4 family)
MGIMRGLGLLVAGLAVAAQWCVSAAANYAHALHLAQGSDYAYVMAAASAGADVLKFIAGMALISAIKKRYVAAALAALLVWVACAGWSVRSGLGFVAITFSDTAAKRGMTASFDLWTWFSSQLEPGNAKLRGTATISLLAADGRTERARFILDRCLPIKLKAPVLSGKDGGIAVEELQLAYETLRFIRPSS